jgi:hypothetical protein
VANLQEAHGRLVKQIASLDDEALNRTLAPIDRRMYAVLHGVLQHNVYHTAQISLMLKAMR